MNREDVANRVASFLRVVERLETAFGRSLGVSIDGDRFSVRTPVQLTKVRAVLPDDQGWSIAPTTGDPEASLELTWPLRGERAAPEEDARAARGPAARLAAWLVHSHLEVRTEIERLRAEAEERNRNLMALYGELDARANELEERNAQKTAFIAVLAHEVRNPLGAIDLAVETLAPLFEREPAAEGVEAYRVLQRQVRHLARMMDDLLDVSRLALGTVVVRKEPTDLVACVRSALRTVEPRAAEKDIHLETRIEESPVAVVGDDTRLEQAVLNLLDNAVKYTPAGGGVRLELSTDREVPLAVLRIEDDGVGMTADQLRQAFEPFVQHHQRLDRGVGGMGLGLTLVRQLVELHGGNVRGEPLEAPRSGTRFEVRLPLASSSDVRESSRPSTVSAPRAERLDLNGVRILLVEDKDDFRVLMARQLRKLGAAVEEAGTGSGALDILRSDVGGVHVVVADVGLPGLNGYELATAAREELGLRELLLVALTGYGGTSAREKAERSGFDAHLVKPVRARDLARTIQAALGAR